MSTLPLTNNVNNSYESDFKASESLLSRSVLRGQTPGMHGLHFSVLSSPLRKINPIYAHAMLPLAEMHKVISLSFVTSSEDLHFKIHKVPHPGLEYLKEDPSVEPPTNKTVGTIGLKSLTTEEAQDEKTFLELTKKVERVLINLQIPDLRDTTSTTETSYQEIIEFIGKLCVDTFPNLKPHESAFLVHKGTEHTWISTKFGSEKSIFSSDGLLPPLFGN